MTNLFFFTSFLFLFFLFSGLVLEALNEWNKHIQTYGELLICLTKHETMGEPKKKKGIKKVEEGERRKEVSITPQKRILENRVDIWHRLYHPTVVSPEYSMKSFLAVNLTNLFLTSSNLR